MQQLLPLGTKLQGGRGKLSLTGHTVKFAAAVGGSMAANRDINQAARWHLWRVTRLVSSEPHLTVEHEEQPPHSSLLDWRREEQSRSRFSRSEHEPCSGLHTRCALGRDTIAQHAVIFHVCEQQLCNLAELVCVCVCAGMCMAKATAGVCVVLSCQLHYVTRFGCDCGTRQPYDT